MLLKSIPRQSWLIFDNSERFLSLHNVNELQALFPFRYFIIYKLCHLQVRWCLPRLIYERIWHKGLPFKLKNIAINGIYSWSNWVISQQQTPTSSLKWSYFQLEISKSWCSTTLRIRTLTSSHLYQWFTAWLNIWSQVFCW